MKNIFISSRMNELTVDREVCYSVCYHLGFRPLMFETEPMGKDLKDELKRLINHSELFLGIYFKTIGARSSQLYYLTPILFELAYFILISSKVGKEIQKEIEKKNKKDKNEKKMEEYLSILRDCLTGHYKIKMNKKKLTLANTIVPKSFEDKISECLRMIEKVEDKIYLYCKSYNDERALSPQLQVFLKGLPEINLIHIDYRNEWDLADKLVNDQRLFDSYKNDYLHETSSIDDNDTSKTNTEQDVIFIDYHGEDNPGQVKLLTKAAFLNYLNIIDIIVDTRIYEGSKKSTIKAILKNVHFQKKISNVHVAYRNKLTEYGVSNIFDLNKDIDLTDTIPLTEAKEKMDYESFSFADFNKKEGKEIRVIRVYHLNVPGIIYNITRSLLEDYITGIENLNVERMITQLADKSYEFPYKGNAYSGNSPKEQMKFEAWGRENMQVTEMLISFEEIKNDSFKNHSNGSVSSIGKDNENNKIQKMKYQILLENALIRIIGVMRVIVSNGPPISVTESEKNNKEN